MLIEISQLPFEIQHQILHIDTSTELSIMQDGHVLCTFLPKINNKIEQEKTLFDCFANACPEVADIELELPKNNQYMMANNAYDYFCNFDYPEHIADIEFELPERSQLNRQDVDLN